MNNEVWKPLVYKFYDGSEFDLSDTLLVSNYGRLKTVKRNKIVSIRLKGSPSGKSENRYNVFTATNNGVTKNLRVHRAVASVFVDGYAPGLEIDHIDDDIYNNNADNFRWLTKAEHQALGCVS